MDSDIPRRTHSDALLVAFAQKHEALPLDIINDFITLLRMRNFKSTQVAFDSVFKIPRHLVEQAQINAQQWALKSDSHLPVPQRVVSLVANHLAQYSLSIFSEDRRRCPNRATLFNMTLVHRSWTNAAQCHLRQRIVILGKRDISDLRSMPHFSPWVRDIYYEPRSRMKPEQFVPFLIEVLRACPNVRNLRLVPFFAYGSETAVFNEVVKELPNLSCLEHLWLENSRFSIGSPDLRLFLQTLPKLTTLKVLTLHNWTDESSQVNSLERVSDMEPLSPALISLSYKSRHMIDINLLSSIFRPGSGLVNLELEYCQFFKELKSLFALQAVQSVLSDITNFRFHVKQNSEEQDSEDPDCFDPLMACVKLQQLTIVIHEEPLITPVMTIPSTLQHLWIHHKKIIPSYDGTDECIFQTIKPLPNLKMLTITFYDPNELAFEEVTAYCSKKRIELIIKFDVDLHPFE